MAGCALTRPCAEFVATVTIARRTLQPGPTDAYLRRTYGISRDFYDQLLEYQGGRCYICHRQAGRTPLGVDHNHNMPKGPDSVRGLLCVRSGRDRRGRDYPACNRIVGMARDNPAFFRRAADYLEQPPAQRLRERLDAEALALMDITAQEIDLPDWVDD